jgi:hypothetical protein
MLLTRVDPMEPPMLQTHGLVDDVVPFTPFNCANAVLLLNTCELVIDPDQDHSVFGYGFWRDFLYRHMIDKPSGVRPTTNVTLRP